MKSTTKERLADLAGLQDGWLDGEGKAITPVAIARARRVLRWMPRGYVYPTPEGGVQWEYDMDNWAATLEFDEKGRIQFSLIEIEYE